MEERSTLRRNRVEEAITSGRAAVNAWVTMESTYVAEILSHLPPELPKTLTLEDQGRFAVGYYHERGTRPVKDEAADDDQEETSDGN